jgi:hypothetical protein
VPESGADEDSPATGEKRPPGPRPRDPARA